MDIFGTKGVHLLRPIQVKIENIQQKQNVSMTPTASYASSSPMMTTESSVGGQDFNDSYKLAAQVAVGAAIIVAFAILLGLIWNSLKRRLPDGNNAGMSSSASRRRYSRDSFDRLVEDRLRNRPPPYSPDQDKPPSYEESFFDSSSIRQHSSVSRSRDRRRHQQSSSTEVPQVHERSRSSPQFIEQGPSTSSSQSSPESLPSYSTTVRIVSYDNQAFSSEEQQQEQSTIDIPSISMAVYRNEVLVGEDGDDEEGVIMLHL